MFANMTPIHDRWLWMGFGVFIFFAAKAIRYAITDIVNLTEVPARSPEETTPLQPEDSISIEDLRTLATSTSPNISAAATYLIISRLARSPRVLKKITRDAHSSNDDTRRKARQTIRFISAWDPMGSRFSQFAGEQGGEVGIDFDPPSMSPMAFDMVNSSSQDIVASLEEISAEIGFQSENMPLSSLSRIPAGRPPATTSPDEAARRRQRREAMVFHEGDGRLVEGDIIRPRR